MTLRGEEGAVFELLRLSGANYSGPDPNPPFVLSSSSTGAALAAEEKPLYNGSTESCRRLHRRGGRVNASPDVSCEAAWQR